MNIKSAAISSFAKFIIGGNTFSRVLRIVSLVDKNAFLRGEEKRALALHELKAIGLDVAQWAVNLAIELAVAWLKSKAGK